MYEIFYATSGNSLAYLIGLFIGITVGSIIVGRKKKWSRSRTFLYIIAANILAYIIVIFIMIRLII